MEIKTLTALDFQEIQQLLAAECDSLGAKEAALAAWPLRDAAAVQELLDRTEEAYRLLLDRGGCSFAGLRTIAAAVERAEKEAILAPQECLDIARSLAVYEDIGAYFREAAEDAPKLAATAAEITPLPQLRRLLERVFDERGRIQDSASVQLGRLRAKQARLQERIKREMNSLIQQREVGKVLQEALVTLRNERYVVPVKAEYRYALPGIVHDRSATGQTLYIEPMVSVELNNDLQEAALAEREEIKRILVEITAAVARDAQALLANAAAAAELDLVTARGKLAHNLRAVRAQETAHMIRLEQARHPLLPPATAVPIDVRIGDGYRILVVTGSNTGGKTVALKTTGLLAAMNQAGLFIPAAPGAALPVFENIWVSIGDEQNMAENLSTFSGHMRRIVTIMDASGERDLVLLDELGSGTDPVEGAALAIAVLDYFWERGALAMVTTHYSELKQYVYTHTGMENAHVEFDEKTLTPTYHLHIGIAGNSQALNITRRLGMNEAVLARAEALKQESAFYEMEQVLAELNEKRKEMTRQEEHLQGEIRKAERAHAKWDAERRELAEKKREILEKTRNDARQMKRELRVQAEQIIKDLKKSAKEAAAGSVSAVAETRRRIDDMEIPAGEERAKIPLRKLQAGRQVYVDTLEKIGTIVAVRGKKLQVEVQGMTISVEAKHCRELLPGEAPAAKAAPARRPSRRTPQPSLRTVETSLNIIGERVADAVPQIEAFLDAALLAGLDFVEIIHGKGTGALREGVHEVLRRHAYVKSFAVADAGQGGSGVTVVYFK
ncbi:MAG: endonuclease MutS2 [Veillonellaceae bacterium]|nr:endonuclease MutS2 [Veillonellaceae bacterium]